MKVTFTDQAAEQLTELADYLELEWSPKVRENFLLKLVVNQGSIWKMEELIFRSE